MSYAAMPTEQRPHDGVRGGGAQVAASVLAGIGVAIGAVSLFLHGWVHANVTFVSQGPSGARVLRPLGVDVDKQLAAIADQQVRAIISPTMWQYKGHSFQFVFALLVSVLVLLFVASFPRARVAAHAVALVASVGAATVILIAFVRVYDGLVALPDNVLGAIQGNAVLRQSFSVTTGKPVVDGGPGWPIFAAGIGVALAVLGTFLGLLFAVAHPSHRRRPR